MKTTRPTTALKQRKVLKNLGENGGNFRKAIKEAGYSQKYANNPQRIINTKTWQEITEEALPDELLAIVHRALLVNEATAIKALDMAYKVKGRYKEAEKPNNDVGLIKQFHMMIQNEEENAKITQIVIVNPNEEEIPYPKPITERQMIHDDERTENDKKLIRDVINKTLSQG
jgi:hypothetical protein